MIKKPRQFPSFILQPLRPASALSQPPARSPSASLWPMGHATLWLSLLLATWSPGAHGFMQQHGGSMWGGPRRAAALSIVSPAASSSSATADLGFDNRRGACEELEDIDLPRFPRAFGVDDADAALGDDGALLGDGEDPSTVLDVLVCGAGPAGLLFADAASEAGLSVGVVDPAPLGAWPNNYGVWVDEDGWLIGRSLDRSVRRSVGPSVHSSIGPSLSRSLLLR